MRRLFIAGILLLTFATAVIQAQCQSTPAVREILDAVQQPMDTSMTPTAREAARAAMLDKALEKYPSDYFLLRARMNSEKDKDSEIRWVTALKEKHIDDRVYSLLAAYSLLGKNTPEAIQKLSAIQASNPEEAQVYIALAIALSSGKFKDKARTQQELDGFLKLCPAPTGPNQLQLIMLYGTAEQMMQTATGVRQRIEKDSDPLLRSTWTGLWALEFKAHPPAEHEALRKQVAQDVARFEQSPERNKLAWLIFLRTGYQDVGDTASVNKINDEILAHYPASDPSKQIIQERWQKLHPFPTAGDKAKGDEFQRAIVAFRREWQKTWPGDSFNLYQLFLALVELHDATPEQVGKAGEDFLAANRKDSNFHGMPPSEFTVADAYLKFKVHMDQVPGLVEEGNRLMTEILKQQIADDRFADELRDGTLGAMDSLKLEKARVLLNYYIATKQPDKAREIDAELDSLKFTDAEVKNWSGLKQSLLERHAQAAEAEGRKLDALLLYRDALAGRTPPPRAGAEDKLTENVERLWKQLGGTPAAYNLFLAKPKIAEATEGRWQQATTPMPEFSLADLDGKNWKLTSFQGKALIVNVWATWCGPCKVELPEFQKLYDKLKNRTDIAVLSFNIDDDIAKVAPFVRDNKYSFPVLLAGNLTDSMDVHSIPRTWLINAKGRFEWEQLGYGGDSNWEQVVMTKLEGMLKQNQ
jgi:thiol-disulfide isomerase/thioredoxin